MKLAKLGVLFLLSIALTFALASFAGATEYQCANPCSGAGCSYGDAGSGWLTKAQACQSPSAWKSRCDQYQYVCNQRESASSSPSTSQTSGNLCGWKDGGQEIGCGLNGRPWVTITYYEAASNGNCQSGPVVAKAVDCRQAGQGYPSGNYATQDFRDQRAQLSGYLTETQRVNSEKGISTDGSSNVPTTSGGKTYCPWYDDTPYLATHPENSIGCEQHGWTQVARKVVSAGQSCAAETPAADYVVDCKSPNQGMPPSGEPSTNLIAFLKYWNERKQLGDNAAGIGGQGVVACKNGKTVFDGVWNQCGQLGANGNVVNGNKLFLVSCTPGGNYVSEPRINQSDGQQFTFKSYQDCLAVSGAATANQVEAKLPVCGAGTGSPHSAGDQWPQCGTFDNKGSYIEQTQFDLYRVSCGSDGNYYTVLLEQLSNQCVKQKLGIDLEKLGQEGQTQGGRAGAAGAGGGGSTPVIPAQPNTPPVLTISPAGPLTVNEGQAIPTVSVTATDADGGTVTITATGVPAGAVFGGAGASRTFGWTPSNTQGQVPPYAVTFTASDGQGGTASGQLSITVNDVLAPINQAPFFTSNPIVRFFLDRPNRFTKEYRYDANAEDPNNNPISFSLAMMGPAGMVIDSITGMVSWVPKALGAFNVQLQASDGSLTANQIFAVDVLNPAKGSARDALMVSGMVVPNQECLTPGSDLVIIISVSDEDVYDQEQASVTVILDDFGISEKAGPFDIQAGGTSTKVLRLPLPDDAMEGLLRVKNSYQQRRASKG
ncbi:hypothetical protein J4475_00480 [Candidatus Woesearchaeota archaeon]|nr:hypothetical protein [Candidatus Woesearchaeota archaeon]